MAAHDLAIEVLGPLVVRRGGEPVSVGGPRPRALLVRLVVAGELVATDRLVEDLWEGDPPRSAVNTLQTYISTMRRALGDTDQSILVREGPGYRLARTGVDVDAARFAELVAAAREEPDPADRLTRLDGALALWRGPALVDVADTDWARPLAQGLEEARLAALEERFDALLELGGHGEAATELAALVEDHPLRERLAAQLVLARYRSGRQADALRAYDRARERLVEELGVDPGPELAALHRPPLYHHPTPPPPVAGRPATARSGADGSPAERALEPLPSTDGAPIERPSLPRAVARYQERPLVGRAGDLDGLRRDWADAAAGAARLVLVSGEPGIGKTRLAAALAATVHAEGATVLWGACPREPLGPFQPFAAALRGYLDALPARDASRVVEHLGPLATLVPELHGAAPDVEVAGATGAGAWDRHLLFEAVASAVAGLASDGGCLLVLDDLHWADPDTCALLVHLLRHRADPAPLILATVRSHDADPNPALVEAVADLQRDRSVVRRPLGGLTIDAVRELAVASAEATGRTADEGAPAVDDNAAALRRATGGNPYFVEELLAARREGSADPSSSPDQGTVVPENVRDVLQARFARLGDAARSVLELAALVGATFDLTVVERAGDVHGDDLLDLVDRAVDAGLLVESTEVLGRYSFGHELVRQALVDGHRATRRARRHLRIAEALETLDASGGVIDTRDLPAAVVHHRLAALPMGDVPLAVAAAARAVRHDVDHLAFAEACTTAETALATFDRTGVPVDPAGRSALLLELGRARRAAGDLAAATEAFTAAADAARSAGRADLEADAVLGVIGPRPTGTRLDYEPADPALLARAERALAALGDADADRRAALLAARAWLLPRTLPVEERLAGVDEALAVAHRSGDAALEARALLARHTALLVPERLDERLDAVIAAVARAVEAGAPDLEVLARVAATTDLLERGDLDEVRAQVARMTELAGRVGQPAFRFYPGTFAVLLALLEGDHRRAEAEAHALFETTRQLRTDVPGEVALLCRLYQVARDRGTLADLFPLLGDLLEGNTQAFLDVAYGLGAAEVGEVDIARAQLGRAVPTEGDTAADPVPRDGLWLGTTALAAETAAILDDAGAGAVLASRLAPFSGRLVAVGTMFCVGSVDRYVGLSHLAAGRLDDADRWLADGTALDRRVGAQPFVVRGLAERALALARRAGPGDRERAAVLADESRRLADALGMGHPWSLRAVAGDRS